MLPTDTSLKRSQKRTVVIEYWVQLSATPAPSQLSMACQNVFLQRNTFPNNTVPTSNGCPLQQWTEGQSLPVQLIHERLRCNELHMLLEAAGNAMSSRPCLNFHLFGHGIQSQSLYSGGMSQIELVLILFRVRWLKPFRKHHMALWPLSLFQQLQKLCCACYRAQSACICVCAADASPPQIRMKRV